MTSNTVNTTSTDEQDVAADLAEVNAYKKLRNAHLRSGVAIYELVFLMRYDTSSQDAAAFYNKIVDIINNFGGEVKGCEYWGLRHLAYKIKKNENAHYYCLHYSVPVASNGALNIELTRNLKVSENIIRHIVIRLSDIDQTKKDIIPTANPGSTDKRDAIYDKAYEVWR